MQTVSASAVTASVVPGRPIAAPESKYLRYTIGITHRQEEAILSECRRRGLGFSELFRRILDGWVERRIAQEGGQ